MLTDEQKETFKILNAQMREFKRNHVAVPDKIKEYQGALQQIYKNNNIDLKNDKTFTVTKKLPLDVEADIVALSEKMLKDKDVAFYGDYKEMQRRGTFAKFGLKSMNDYIEGLNTIQAYRSDSQAQALLSSDQFVETVLRGKKKAKMKPEDVIGLMSFEHSLTKTTGDSLQMKLYEAIEDYDTLQEDKAQITRSKGKAKSTKF